MIKLFNRHSVSILNKSWQPIKEGVRVKFLPRYGEFIFLEETKRYYKVLNVIHYLNNKAGVFIIVEEFGEEIPTQNI